MGPLDGAPESGKTAPLERLLGYSVAPLWRRGARHDANFFLGISKKGKVPLTKYCGNVKKETPKIKKNSRDDLKKEMGYKQIKTYDKNLAPKSCNSSGGVV